MDLVDVVKTNSIQNVREALKQDWDHITLKRGIYFAIGQGNLGIVQLILSAVSRMVSKQLNDEGCDLAFIAYHHLADAVFQGHTEIVRLLLEKGALCHLQNEMTTDSDQPTILMLASQEGYFEIVKILVEAGANVNTMRQGNANALLSAASNGYQDIFDYLYPLTDPKLREEALDALPSGLRMREFENNADPLICTLTTALYQEEFEHVQEILSAEVNVNALNDSGCSALFVAVLKRWTEAIQLLLNLGANPNLGDAEDGRTPLMVLSGGGWHESSIICSLLLEAGANVNAYDDSGQTPLMHIMRPLAFHEDSRMAKQRSFLLLLEAGAEANARDAKNGQTVLMQVLQTLPSNEVEERDKKEIIIALLEFGADISLADYSGRTITQRSDVPYDLELSAIPDLS